VTAITQVVRSKPQAIANSLKTTPPIHTLHHPHSSQPNASKAPRESDPTNKAGRPVPFDRRNADANPNPANKKQQGAMDAYADTTKHARDGGPRPQPPRTNDPYERGGGAGNESRSVLPAHMVKLADSLLHASPEQIRAAAERWSPGSTHTHLANTIGNLMIARNMRAAELNSGRNLADSQQQSL